MKNRGYNYTYYGGKNILRQWQQYYANKFENLEAINNFPEKYN